MVSLCVSRSRVSELRSYRWVVSALTREPRRACAERGCPRARVCVCVCVCVSVKSHLTSGESVRPENIDSAGNEGQNPVHNK